MSQSWQSKCKITMVNYDQIQRRIQVCNLSHAEEKSFDSSPSRQINL